MSAIHFKFFIIIASICTRKHKAGRKTLHSNLSCHSYYFLLHILLGLLLLKFLLCCFWLQQHQSAQLEVPPFWQPLGHSGFFSDQNWWCVEEPGWLTWWMQSRYLGCSTCLLQPDTAQCNWTHHWMLLQLLWYLSASPVPFSFSAFVQHARNCCHLSQWLSLLCSEQQDRLVSSGVYRPERKWTKSLTLSATEHKKPLCGLLLLIVS